MRALICEILAVLGFDATFVRMFREAYLPWGARAGELAGAGAVPFTDTQRASLTGLSPGAPVHVTNTANCAYLFSSAPVDVTAAAGANGGKLLLAGEHVRIVPPGCDRLTAIALAGDTTGGFIDCHRLPKITGDRINW